MSDSDRICAKLDKLYAYYQELKNISNISLEEYNHNILYRRAIERTMQLHDNLEDINQYLKQIALYVTENNL